MSPKKRSTIYDLAEQAGISASTVSAILNGSWRKRRVSEKTAERVLTLARKLAYTVNRQASGLRRSRSGLIGMIVPMHDNRFFSGMSQTFEQLARQRGLYPLVVSTLRDPSLELETARTLISYQIESLVIAGATDPDPISHLCRSHGVAHINVDLPGTLAPSVISDNRWGAQQLTGQLVLRSHPLPHLPADHPRQQIYFIGGIASDHSTRERIGGFCSTLQKHLGACKSGQINACGYQAEEAETAMTGLYNDLQGLPRALFVNSTIAFEGVVRFLSTRPAKQVMQCTIGCYDWDPFAACLHFPVLMVRQDTTALLNKAFELLDAGKLDDPVLIQVRPQLLEPTSAGN
ncbi:MAG: LacI family DNA-binding transcriptional regulator [Brachymonas sp.]|nr:LacI family DNA-binding transcriptional regulator [Brachymonas sp.]